MKSNTKKLTMAAFFVAIAVVFSFVNIPVGLAKCYPIQHMVNVLSAVLLGPLYSVLVAFCTSLIRNMSGTGSLMAFPGSMIGAFFAGILFYQDKKTFPCLFRGSNWHRSYWCTLSLSYC